MPELWTTKEESAIIGYKGTSKYDKITEKV